MFLTTPSAPFKGCLRQYFLEVASTPPLKEGNRSGFSKSSKASAARLLREPAAVDAKCRTGDVGCCVGTKINCGADDFLRRADPVERNLPRQRVATRGIFAQAFSEVRIDISGR